MNSNAITKWDKRFLQLAKCISEWSKDPSTKVGAVIVTQDTHEVLGMGFNGFPRTMEDSALLYGQRQKKYERIIHAEMNAILQMKPSLGRPLTLYTWPFQPCSRCMVHIGQTDINEVVAPELSPTYEKRWGEDMALARELAQEMRIHMEYVKEWDNVLYL